MIRKWLELNFGMSRREYNGLVMLAILIAAVRAFSLATSWWQHTHPDLPGPAELVAVEELQALPAPGPFENRSGRKLRPKPQQRLFRFDPNKASAETWQQLGLSQKQAAAVVRYREKGGLFKTKADVARMYTIRPELYKQLEDFIDIDLVDQQIPRTRQDNDRPALPAVIVPLHEADSALLTTVRGLGPAFASRIVRYRERLGGFYSLLQLAEVYGMDSLRLKQILPQLRLDPERLRAIPVNRVTFDELKGHPYLRYKQISAIIAYRNQHGSYKSIEDLKKVIILPPETIQKIAPYLSFQ